MYLALLQSNAPMTDRVPEPGQAAAGKLLDELASRMESEFPNYIAEMVGPNMQELPQGIGIPDIDTWGHKVLNQHLCCESFKVWHPEGRGGPSHYVR